MKKLTMLSATAGLVTLVGVAKVEACQDCVPDTNRGGMMCISGGGGWYGACSEHVEYDGAGNEIPGSKYCMVSNCDGTDYYSFTRDDWNYEECLYAGICAE